MWCLSITLWLYYFSLCCRFLWRTISAWKLWENNAAASMELWVWSIVVMCPRVRPSAELLTGFWWCTATKWFMTAKSHNKNNWTHANVWLQLFWVHLCLFFFLSFNAQMQQLQHLGEVPWDVQGLQILCTTQREGTKRLLRRTLREWVWICLLGSNSNFERSYSVTLGNHPKEAIPCFMWICGLSRRNCHMQAEATHNLSLFDM